MQRAEESPPLLFLAPGASGGLERLAPHLAGLARRGVDARPVALPRGRVEPAVRAYRAALVGFDMSRAAIGGHSFGGRVASLLAAESPPAALVLLSYPLHAPGRQSAWRERTDHWPAIRCPVLLLSGTSDPFADPALMRRAIRRLPEARLVTYPGVRHGLEAVLDDALDRVAAFLRAATLRRAAGR